MIYINSRQLHTNLGSSVVKLIENLPHEKNILLQTISGADEVKMYLINKEGLFPNEFFDSIKKLNQTVSKLTKRDFYSPLNLSKISTTNALQVVKIYDFVMLKLEENTMIYI